MTIKEKRLLSVFYFFVSLVLLRVKDSLIALNNKKERLEGI